MHSSAFIVPPEQHKKSSEQQRGKKVGAGSSAKGNCGDRQDREGRTGASAVGDGKRYSGGTSESAKPGKRRVTADQEEEIENKAGERRVNPRRTGDGVGKERAGRDFMMLHDVASGRHLPTEVGFADSAQAREKSID